MRLTLCMAAFGALLPLLSNAAWATTGVSEIRSARDGGAVTLFYPSSSTERRVERGDFVFQAAWDGQPEPGNGRLVVISHGSGGSPWLYRELAQALVAADFVVAMPSHAGDNSDDPSAPGPESWKRRPLEVSAAIDAVQDDDRFDLALDRVGAYGMSAGGHTMLSLAGGQWSEARFRQHCDEHLAEDFQTCVGLITRLNGGLLDPLKQWAARRVIRRRFEDPHMHAHQDRRVAAVVSGVPLAADFDLRTLASPPIPVGIISARQDRWLIPLYHSDALLQACGSCEHLSDLEQGGHGALLAPLPAIDDALLEELIGDPPGFDRATEVPRLNALIIDFFERHLLEPAP